jgi:hypothetical protein
MENLRIPVALVVAMVLQISGGVSVIETEIRFLLNPTRHPME